MTDTGIKELFGFAGSLEAVWGTLIDPPQFGFNTIEELSFEPDTEYKPKRAPWGTMAPTTQVTIGKQRAAGNGKGTFSFRESPLFLESLFGRAVPGCGGGGAQLTAVLSGDGVDTVTIDHAGWGYVTAPLITFTGGGGADAEATATVVDGRITLITVTVAGTSYETPPTVVITPVPVGSAATATAVLGGGGVSTIALTGGGSGYTYGARVTVTGATSGNNAVIRPTIVGGVITELTIISAGSGYVGALTVSFLGGPFVRQYAPPTSSIIPQADIQSFSFFKGQTPVAGQSTYDVIYAIAGAVLSTFQVDVDTANEMGFAFNYLGKKVQPTTNMPVFVHEQIQYSYGYQAQLLMDTWDDAGLPFEGGTETDLTGVGYSFGLMLDSKRDLKWYLGSRTPGGHRDTPWGGQAKMALEFTPDNHTMYDIAVNGTEVVQRHWQMRVIQDVGNAVVFTFAGFSPKPNAVADRESTLAVDWSFDALESPRLGNWCEIFTVNDVGRYPY